MTFNPYPSTATKAFLIRRVYVYLGQAGYEFDKTPEQDVDVLDALDGLMAEWAANGINLNYNFPSEMGGGDPADVMGVPDFAINTIAVSTAIRVAPGIGKTLSMEAKKALADGMATIRASTLSVPTMRLPRTTPIGSGNRYRSTPAPFARCYVETAFTLKDLTLSDQFADVGDGYIAVVGNYAMGARLKLIEDLGGKYKLIGNVLYGFGLTEGTDKPIVSQIYPGATNSPHATILTIYVGDNVNPVPPPSDEDGLLDANIEGNPLV